MRKRGFTLVEIMIVVAIISLLAAIAIPNLLTARRTANEAAAKATLSSLATAAETYAAANGGTYPRSLFSYRHSSLRLQATMLIQLADKQQYKDITMPAPWI